MWILWILAGSAFAMGGLMLMMADWPATAVGWCAGGALLGVLFWAGSWWHLVARQRKRSARRAKAIQSRFVMVLPALGAVVGSLVYPFLKAYLTVNLACGFWSFLGAFFVGASLLLPRWERSGLVE